MKVAMLKALFVICAIWILGCSASQDNSNDYQARIAENGLYNSTLILQLGDLDPATELEVGDDRRVAILQTGDWDTAPAAQVGAVNTTAVLGWRTSNIVSQIPIATLNWISVEQIGSLNQCLHTQNGTGHLSNVRQIGDSNSAIVVQGP